MTVSNGRVTLSIAMDSSPRDIWGCTIKNPANWAPTVPPPPCFDLGPSSTAMHYVLLER